MSRELSTVQYTVISVPDEAGRVVQFRVQIDGDRIGCWLVSNGQGGTISVTALFAVCVKETASR